MAKHKLSIGKVKLAIEQAGGIRSAAARTLKVSRVTLWRFINRHPALQEFLAEVDEEVLDMAEVKILQAIRAGDMHTVRWFLECKGKDRGYTRRVETTGKDGGPIEVKQKLDLTKLTEQELEILLAAAERQEGASAPSEHHKGGGANCDCAHCAPRRTSPGARTVKNQATEVAH